MASLQLALGRRYYKISGARDVNSVHFAHPWRGYNRPEADSPWQGNGFIEVPPFPCERSEPQGATNPLAWRP